MSILACSFLIMEPIYINIQLILRYLRRFVLVSYTVLVTGDWHAGHKTGLRHPDYEMWEDDAETSMKLGMSRLQEKIFEKFEHMVDYCGHVSYTFLMGDLVEGPNGKNNGLGLITSDIDEQINLAFYLAKMIKCRRFVTVHGSDYHAGYNLSYDKQVARRLGAEYKNKIEFGDEYRKEIGGTNFYLRHSTPYTPKRENRVNSLISEIKEVTTEPNYLEGSIHCAIHGHTHYSEQVTYRGITKLVCPSFKGKDSYAKKKNCIKPEQGFHLIEIDGPGDYQIYSECYMVD